MWLPAGNKGARSVSAMLRWAFALAIIELNLSSSEMRGSVVRESDEGEW